MLSEILQWSGCAIALTATLMLALNVPSVRWAWVLYLVANILWTAYGVVIHANGLVVMNAGFMVTSILGIYRTFYREPRLQLQPQSQPVTVR